MAAAVPAIAAVGKFVGANAATILGGTAAAGSAAAALKKPKAPSVPDPVPMPDPQAQEAERRRKLAAEAARSGRASTILGGGDGSRDTLG